jgi:hypothetical protein
VRLEGLDKLKKSTLSGTRSGDLLVCSIVPQPATLPRGGPPSYSITELPSELVEISKTRETNVISIYFK